MYAVVKGAILRALDACDKRRRSSRLLSPDSWNLEVRGQELCWEGCSLPALAKQHGTPLHVISRARLEKNYRAFLSAFKDRYERTEVMYSYKTNPLPGVIRVLHDLGAGAEVISHLELWLALRLGVPPDRIILNGPGKTRAALELAVERGIRLVNIDNLDEIGMLGQLADEHGCEINVGVRVVTSAGWAGQFGLRRSTGAAWEAFRRLRSTPRLVPSALHIHLGHSSPELHFRALEETLEFAGQLRDSLGIEIRYLDLGGGFAVPTVRSLRDWDNTLLVNGLVAIPPQADEGPTPGDYAEGIIGRIADACDLATGDAPQVILEPGRAITSSAQTLLVSVLAVKSGDRFREYVIADGGANIAAPLAYEYHQAFVANRANESPSGKYGVFGPLCFPRDRLFRHVELPALQSGDTIAIMDAGAYFVPHQTTFSNPRPAAVLISSGGSTLIRRRESFESVVQLDIF